MSRKQEVSLAWWFTIGASAKDFSIIAKPIAKLTP
jgi:hypothetical protein